MKYLDLTHPQIESIQSEFFLFDSDEVIYYATIRSENGTPIINSLEILIGEKWIPLIEADYPTKEALFTLTNEQYKEIIHHERSRNI